VHIKKHTITFLVIPSAPKAKNVKELTGAVKKHTVILFRLFQVRQTSKNVKEQTGAVKNAQSESVKGTSSALNAISI
jgi:hypothetical protein